MNAAAPKPVPYQPAGPAQIRPDVSLAVDRRADSRPLPLSPQPRHLSHPANISADGRGASAFVNATLRGSAASNTSLDRTTQLVLPRG
jgi:hypothetical protein